MLEFILSKGKAMLKTVIIDITCVNEGDSLKKFTENTGYFVTEKISKEFRGSADALLITDSREKANIGKMYGIGFALYINEYSHSSDFPDALYCIESLFDLDDISLERIYLRTKNLPWTILETNRCIVREITLDDIDDLYRIYSNPETKRYIEDLYPKKEDEILFTKEYIAHQYRFFEYGMWVVIDKKSGKLIGRAGLSDRDGFDITEIGFLFDKSFWGMGYAFEICSGILKYAKEKLYMDEMISFTMNENKRAKKLLERLGFNHEGTRNINSGTFLYYKKKL